MWLERLEAERFWPEIWLEHQELDDYWKHGSVCFDYGAIECPTWFWGGWADLYRDTPLRLAEHLKVPHRVTVGPWAHLYPHEAIPAPAVGFLQEALRWWDHWLKGRRPRGHERSAAQFLHDGRIGPQVLTCCARGALGCGEALAQSECEACALRAQRRRIAAERARRAAPVSLRSPQSTGLASGDWGSFGNPGDVPGDQREDSFGSLEFTSGAADGAIAKSWATRGRYWRSLRIGPDAFVAVRLIDVAPNGAATCVARGFLNLTHRDGREEPKPWCRASATASRCN